MAPLILNPELSRGDQAGGDCWDRAGYPARAAASVYYACCRKTQSRHTKSACPIGAQAAQFLVPPKSRAHAPDARMPCLD